MFLFFVFYLYPFKFFNKKIIFFKFVSYVCYFFSINDNLRKSTFDRTFKQLGIVKSELSYKEHQNFFDSQWGAHYLTAYEIFKDNKLDSTESKTLELNVQIKIRKD